MISRTNYPNYMTPKEFFYAVSHMRDCQKAYFKSRSQSTLRAARASEIAVDNEIARVKEVLYQMEHKQ